MLILAFLAFVLMLGACSKKEKGTKVNETIQEEKVQKEIKEIKNELAYEVDGENKTVPAEQKTIGVNGKSIMVPEGFQVLEDSVAASITHKAIPGLGFTIKNSSESKENYQLGYWKAETSNVKELTTTGYKNIDRNFNYVIVGQSPFYKMTSIVKNPGADSDTMEIYITIPNEKYSEEVEAKIYSMINSMY